MGGTLFLSTVTKHEGTKAHHPGPAQGHPTMWPEDRAEGSDILHPAPVGSVLVTGVPALRK